MNVIPEWIIFVSRGITVLLVPLFPLPMCLLIFLVFILLLFWFWLLALVVKIWFGAVLLNSHLIFHSDHCSRPDIVGQGISLILSSIPMTPQGHFGLFNLWYGHVIQLVLGPGAKEWGALLLCTVALEMSHIKPKLKWLHHLWHMYTVWNLIRISSVLSVLLCLNEAK